MDDTSAIAVLFAAISDYAAASVFLLSAKSCSAAARSFRAYAILASIAAVSTSGVMLPSA